MTSRRQQDGAATARTLVDKVAAAMQRRDFVGAAMQLEAALAASPDRIDLWLTLAAARRAEGRLPQALEAANSVLRLAPRHFHALLLRASLLERLEGEPAASPVYGAAILQAPDNALLEPAVRHALDHAREVNRRHSDALYARLNDSVAGLALSRSATRKAEQFVEQLTGRRRAYHQEPLGYHYPGLPSIEFWDADEFPWIGRLQDQAAAIRAEMIAVGFEDPALTPYIAFPDLQPLDQWESLNRSMEWTAFHLYQHGLVHEENARRCPATMAALADIEQPVAKNRSPSAMFSVLKPGTHIPPHTGVANTRLVAHLALVVPEGCWFRVGAETRAWREGAAWVFDDTIEHEAWNDSKQPRAVLIFDVWNPQISPEERDAICAIMAAMDDAVEPGGGI